MTHSYAQFIAKIEIYKGRGGKNFNKGILKHFLATL